MFAFATWIPVVITFNSFVAELTWIQGASMYPFLNPEKDQTLQRDLVLNWKYSPQEGLAHGMIVTFWSPSDPERTAVKRIVGLEGDVVRTREPYPVRTVQVPPGHVWVEGDGGTRDSLDSNTYGPISTGLIIGKGTSLSDKSCAGSEGERLFVGQPPTTSNGLHFLPASGPRRHIHLHLLPQRAMSLAHRIANYFAVPTAATSDPVAHSAGLLNDGPYEEPRPLSDFPAATRSLDANMTPDEELETRPPILHSMLAGGLGGTTGDMLMHSLDTVKTRQQGDPHFPPRYTSLGSSYYTIWRQEGIRRGLYGGWLPAMMGSFPGTVLFFGTYEWSKRHMLDYGIQPHVAYLTAGFLGDLAASVVYVPSEVLKTRLQLQGRYNNPFFASGYNYRGTFDAARTIVRVEGPSALFHGYMATLYRDLPFSALQFMFYEQFQAWAKQWKQSRDIGVPLELLTGAAGGGLAGAMTCPLDVVKTRLQTQIESPPTPVKSKDRAAVDAKAGVKEAATKSIPSSKQRRPISTSSPSTHTPRPGAITLDTSSVYQGLKLIYKTEGIGGWFRGVGPRFVWTSVQSGCMLFLYQSILRKLEVWMPLGDSEAAL
ncbi:hypothetical protein JX265_000238 [Neoarthrinium moseri]|uniref:Peptidase S26 domain-containing protein n=1 Tax=Neoarthrinium moseri TaxID=1658444 RepID=A0A9P9WYH9_9PEZI|nr:hypothetical protein JX266_001969 [Neoarthrinium moseri]KAI1881412.1 hypothetical protein JX265_000238 [Neoarthrinium moseri]